MSTTQTTSVKDLAFLDLEMELDKTRRVLERVPDEHLGWKPHEKSMTLGQLAAHVVNLLFWQLTTTDHDRFDLAENPQGIPQPERMADVMARFETLSEQAKDSFERMTDDALHEPWSLVDGERVFFTMPRAVVLRNFVFNHIAHHRGQLTVYLRLLNIPLPAIYGPSADEPMS